MVQRQQCLAAAEGQGSEGILGQGLSEGLNREPGVITIITPAHCLGWLPANNCNWNIYKW